MNLKRIIKAVQRFDKQEREKDNSPPLILQQILIDKTKKLCQKAGADENIALIGAYLMDIKVGQALREGRIQDHINMSLQAGRDFLGKFNLPEQLVKKIENIIEAHHASVPYESLEAEIVANADCFKFLHPRGAIFFLTDLGRRKMEFDQVLDYFETKIEEKNKIISLDVCKHEAERYYRMLKNLVSSSRKLV
ncbi:MAG TPA: hypothetical protein VMW41_01350 [Candidatus Bathyarchaeia archaeon]|nr:hypothetical protein [Candidatus Bathyarchaeia archaeon]